MKPVTLTPPADVDEYFARIVAQLPPPPDAAIRWLATHTVPRREKAA